MRRSEAPPARARDRGGSRRVAAGNDGGPPVRVAGRTICEHHRPTMTPITFGADEIFLLDPRPRRGAVFRRQQAALFGQDHPAIAPPVRQHALVVDEVVARPAAKMRACASSSESRRRGPQRKTGRR